MLPVILGCNAGCPQSGARFVQRPAVICDHMPGEHHPPPVKIIKLLLAFEQSFAGRVQHDIFRQLQENIMCISAALPSFLKELQSRFQHSRFLWHGSSSGQVSTFLIEMYLPHTSSANERHRSSSWTGMQSCQRQSEGSSRRSHFYELDVQVQSMESLEHSLV